MYAPNGGRPQQELSDSGIDLVVRNVGCDELGLPQRGDRSRYTEPSFGNPRGSHLWIAVYLNRYTP